MKNEKEREVFRIGLWAGKEVAEKIDAFIKLEHWNDTDNFDPEKRKEMPDGSVVYSFLSEWGERSETRSFACVEDRLYYSVLSPFHNESPKNVVSERAFKIVYINDHGVRNSYYNTKGWELFKELSLPRMIHFPAGFDDDEEGEYRYLYEEYNDDYDYGEEVAEIFDYKEDAEAFLRERVEGYFGKTWEEIKANNIFELEDDFLTSDYVAYNTSKGTIFWLIKKKKVHKKGERPDPAKL